MVSFAFERLQSQKAELPRRSAKSNIDPVKMGRVVGLLDDISSVISGIPDAKLSPGMRDVKLKVEAALDSQSADAAGIKSIGDMHRSLTRKDP